MTGGSVGAAGAASAPVAQEAAKSSSAPAAEEKKDSKPKSDSEESEGDMVSQFCLMFFLNSELTLMIRVLACSIKSEYYKYLENKQIISNFIVFLLICMKSLRKLHQ